MDSAPPPAPMRVVKIPKASKLVVTIGLDDLVGRTGDITDDLRSDKKRVVRWQWQYLGAESRPAILAFDPGKETGWARMDGGAHFSGGLMRTRDGAVIGREWLSLVRMRIDDFARAHRMGLPTKPALVVVEDAFLMRGPGGVVMNQDGTFRLMRLIGAIIAVATDYQLPCVRVQPPTWQAAVLGSNRRAEGKIASIDRARAIFGERIKTDHESDAALLAWWAACGQACREGR